MYPSLASTLWLCLLLALGAAGCGQKGDLYLPDQAQARSESPRNV